MIGDEKVTTINDYVLAPLHFFELWLWIVSVMAALHSICGHYIFSCSFSAFYLFFCSPILSRCRLNVYHTSTVHTWCGLSANLGFRSQTCCTRLAENTGCEKLPKICYLRTIAQLCRAISSQLRHISTVGKKLVKQQYLPYIPLQYGELWPTSGWDRFVSLGYPS